MAQDPSYRLGHMVRQAFYQVAANVERPRKGDCMASESTMGPSEWVRAWQIEDTINDF